MHRRGAGGGIGGGAEAGGAGIGLHALMLMRHAEGEADGGEGAGIAEPHAIAPVQRLPRAAIQVVGRAAAATIRQVQVAAPVLGDGGAEPRGPGAVEQARLGAELAEPAAVIAVVVRVVIRDVVQFQPVLAPAQHTLDAGGAAGPAEAGGAGAGAQRLGFLRVAGDAARGGVAALGGQALADHQVVPAAQAAGRAERAAGGALAAAGEVAEDLHRHAGRRAARHQVDDAADGAGAIQRRPRPAHHLDPLDIGEQFIAEVEGAVRFGGIVHRHAIQQHQNVAGGGAADEDAGLLAEAAALHHVHARHRGQGFGEGLVAAFLDIRAGQHGDGGGHALRLRRDSRRGDDGLGQGRLGQGRGGQQQGQGEREGRSPEGGIHSHRFPPCDQTTSHATLAGSAAAGVVAAGGDERTPAGHARRWPVVPLRRCTPPGTRVTSLRRPVSWLVEGPGGSLPKSCPRLLGPDGPNGVRETVSPPTVAGAAADGARRIAPPGLRAFPFQPLRATGA